MIRPIRLDDCCSNVLAMVAEFESDLIRLRTREGMQVAKAKGRLRGKQPKLKPNQAKHLLELHDLGTYSTGELAELFGVGRFTIYRTLKRLRPTREPERPFAHLTNEHPTDRASRASRLQGCLQRGESAEARPPQYSPTEDEPSTVTRDLMAPANLTVTRDRSTGPVADPWIRTF